MKLHAYLWIGICVSIVLTACSFAGRPVEQDNGRTTDAPESTVEAPAFTGTAPASPVEAPASTGAAPPAASLPADSPTQAIPPPGLLTGQVVYAREGDVYVMNADGSQVRRLTEDPAADFDPTWSPDGAQIAFRSHRDGNEEVYLMNADGSGQINLTNAPGGDYSPAWSPDGQWIAFMSDRDGSANLWVIRPDGSEIRQVTDLPGISEYPSWSPDSSQITFHCTMGRVLPNGTGDFEICIVNADGTGLVQLTDAPGESKLPDWSPDGTKIAFQSNRSGWPTLPDYQPPGYDPGRYGDYEIYMMNRDGSNQQNLTNHPREDDTFPAWTHAGYLIFSRYDCLILMNTADASLVQISKVTDPGTAPGACTGPDSGHFADWHQSSN